MPRIRSAPTDVFLTSLLVLVAVALTWRISDLKFAGEPLDLFYRNGEVLLLLFVPAAVAAFVTLGIRLADAKLARISNRRPDTNHAAQIPLLVQAAAVAFVGEAFAWIGFLAATLLDLDAVHRWLPPVLLGGPQLVVMYYFAHRFIDIDMLRPDVRPWFLSTMLLLGTAGLALAKFFPSFRSSSTRPQNNTNITVELAILAVFALIGMSVRRRDEPAA